MLLYYRVYRVCSFWLALVILLLIFLVVVIDYEKPIAECEDDEDEK